MDVPLLGNNNGVHCGQHLMMNVELAEVKQMKTVYKNNHTSALVTICDKNTHQCLRYK